MSDLDLFWMPLLFLGVPIAAGWGYALRYTLRVRLRVGECNESARLQRAAASLLLVLLLLGGFLVLSIGPPWFRAYAPPTLIRRTEIRVLAVAEFVYGTAVLIAAFALIPLLAAWIRKRTPARVRFWSVRCLVLAISTLVAAGLAEGAAVACLWASSIPMPWRPIRFADRSD